VTSGRPERPGEAELAKAELAAFDDALIRTHLANERTFLAWLRSAVVLLGVGLGAVALGGTRDLEEVVALTLGGVSALAALVMVVWAYISFAQTTAGIERRVYRTPRAFIATATLLVAVTGSVVVALLAVEALD
jgi:putative membrane protein